MPFPRTSRVVSTSWVWQREKRGPWRRYMVRALQNGTYDWSQLTRVEGGTPVCFACLSTDVDVDEEMLVCHSCGVRYTIV